MAMRFDIEKLQKDRSADFKAKDPATFIDSHFEKQFNEWLERVYANSNMPKIKLKRRK